MRKFYPLIVVFLIATACTTVQPAVVILPNATEVVATPTPIPKDLPSAERTARAFLEAWVNQDWQAMYNLTTFASQEATPFETFRERYENTQLTLTLESLAYTANTMFRQSPEVVVFNYDVTFSTNVFNDIEDKNRDLRLVVDPQVNEWRIAWSFADIFPEMGDGAQLIFESRVPSRANIYDRNGEVLADQNGSMVRVNVIKNDIPDLTACLANLSNAVSKTPEAILQQIDQFNPDWVVEVGLIESAVYALTQGTLERECNATFDQKSARQYPQGTLMPHILGNVGFPDEDDILELRREGFAQDTIIGKSGIEQGWDDILRGRAGGSLYLLSPSGEITRFLAEAQPQPSKSVWLTIDSELQEFITGLFNTTYQEATEIWAPVSTGAAAVVLDVNTGEILAMVTYPTFDGNALSTYPTMGRERANKILEEIASNRRVPQLNRPTQATLPTGSTMKVIGAVAVSEEGIYPATSHYVCSGIWQVGNDVRHDWLPGGHGSVTTSTALTQSCNPFFYEVGYQLNQVDESLLPNYAKLMGLGSGTGLEDIDEQPGFIPDPDWLFRNFGEPWTFSHSVTMSIGQGEVAVTPLQVARMYAALANDGQLLRPQLVREVGILDTREFMAEPDVMETYPFSTETMNTVRTGLCDVTVKPYGTATHIFRDSPLHSIGVCGKTGTAQSGGELDPPHAWFVGWAPAEKPEIITLVVVEKAGEGSAVAAPLVKQIMEYYFFLREES